METLTRRGLADPRPQVNQRPSSSESTACMIARSQDNSFKYSLMVVGAASLTFNYEEKSSNCSFNRMSWRKKATAKTSELNNETCLSPETLPLVDWRLEEGTTEQLLKSLHLQFTQNPLISYSSQKDDSSRQDDSMVCDINCQIWRRKSDGLSLFCSISDLYRVRGSLNQNGRPQYSAAPCNTV